MALTESEELELLELEAQAAKPSGPVAALKSAGNAILGGVNTVAEGYRNNIVIPSRKAVGLPATGEDFSKKVGLDDKNALIPPWAQKALKGGPMGQIANAIYGDGKTPAQIGAYGYEQVADPANLLPFVGKAVSYGARKIGPMATKIASARTGIPQKAISTYAADTKGVDNIIAAHGGDITSAAEGLQAEMDAALKSAANRESTRIGKALEMAPQTKNVPTRDVIEGIQANVPGRMGIDGDLPMAARLSGGKNSIGELENLTDDLIRATKGGAPGSIEDVHALKQSLQDIAKGTYNKDGRTFQVGDLTQRSAKAGGAIARKALASKAPEDYVRANAALEKIHLLEERLKTAGQASIRTPGKPVGGIISAGAGTNPRVNALMRRIGDVTGTNPAAKAEKIAAASEFANPGFTAKDVTGKGTERFLKGIVGGGVGGAIAGAPAGPLGALIGAGTGALASAAFSPAALKKLIQAKTISADAIKAIAKVPAAQLANPVTDAVILKAFKEIQSGGEGAKILEETLKKAAEQPAPRPKETATRQTDSIRRRADWK